MGTLVYRGYNVGYRSNLVVPPTQYTAVVMTDEQYATIAALCSAKSLTAGMIFYVPNGADTLDNALAAARLVVLQGRNLTLSLPYDAYSVDTGATSVTYVQESYLTQDVIPQCQTVDLFLGQTAAASGDTGAISVYTFDQLVAAVANAPINAVIKLADATFDFVDTLHITKPITILADRSVTFWNASVALAKPLIAIELAAQSAEANVIFKNVSFYHLTAGYNNIQINNTNVGQKLKVYFMDCTSEITCAGAGLGLKVSHATTSKAIEVRFTGKGYHKLTNVTWVAGNAGDLLECFGMRVLLKSTSTDAITVDNGAVTANFVLKCCETNTGHAIVTGHANQRATSLYSYTDNGSGTLAAVVTGDLTGSGAENIVP